MTGRVDAHVHLWNRSTDPQDWIDPATMAVIDRDFGTDELEAMLRSTGMERAVVVQASNSLEESARLARLDPATVAGLVAWVDLRGDVPEQLARIRDGATVPVVGVRHLVHIDPDPEWLGHEAVGRGLIAYKHGFTDTTSFVDTLLVEAGSTNTFTQNDAGLQVDMSKKLALKVGYQVRHNSDVAPGIKATDQLITTNLVYNFGK